MLWCPWQRIIKCNGSILLHIEQEPMLTSRVMGVFWKFISWWDLDEWVVLVLVHTSSMSFSLLAGCLFLCCISLLADSLFLCSLSSDCWNAFSLSLELWFRLFEHHGRGCDEVEFQCEWTFATKPLLLLSDCFRTPPPMRHVLEMIQGLLCCGNLWIQTRHVDWLFTPLQLMTASLFGPVFWQLHPRVSRSLLFIWTFIHFIIIIIKRENPWAQDFVK